MTEWHQPDSERAHFSAASAENALLSIFTLNVATVYLADEY